MIEKLQDRLAYPPRGMRAESAAAYLGMSKSKFLELVDRGKLSAPIHIDGMRVWDRLRLDADFEALESNDTKRRANTVDLALGLKDE
jgi:hypothetical protein